MTRIREIKTTFTAGEISRDLLGRGDLRAYENGALALRNVFINPTGGITRRAGLSYVDTAAGNGKLISFEFNTEQTCLLVMTDEQIAIYADGALLETLAAPWTGEQIAQVAWTQSADTLLFTHPGQPPKKLTRNADASWTLSDWTFFTDANVMHQPYFKFADTAVTLTPSATTGTITITASAAESLDTVSDAMRSGGISLEQITEANRHAEKIAELQLTQFQSEMSEANETIRAEAASSDPYVRRMRPTFGYLMAITWAAQMLALAWVIVFQTDKAGFVLQAMGSLSAMWAFGLSVLGIYIYKRSEEKRFTPGDAIYWSGPRKE